MARKRSDYFSILLFLVATFILSFIFFNILISSVLFIFKVNIQSFYPIISLIISLSIQIILLYKYRLTEVSNILLAILSPLVIIIISILFSGMVMDSSYDGNTYHKLSIGMLMDGWNPIYQTVEEFDSIKEDKMYVPDEYSIWINHYPKASYYYGASVGKLTNNVECGKSINILSMCALFFLCISLLFSKTGRFISSILLGICISSTSVVLSQLLTNYVDGLVYIYMFILMGLFIGFDSKLFLKTKIPFFITYFITLIMLINIKFSSFAFAGIFCLGYYIWYIYRKKKRRINNVFFKQFTIISIISVIVGFFLIGLATYPKNMYLKHNLFYPIMGKDKVDIITENQPIMFQGMTPILKYFIATFSTSDNIDGTVDAFPKLKIPFTFTSIEKYKFFCSDLRISGNGYLFGGIFIISIILLIILFMRNKNNKDHLINIIVIPLIITVLLILFFPESWWARYFPMTHFIIFASLILLNREEGKVFRVILYIFISLILLNSYNTLKESSEYSFGFTKLSNLYLNSIEKVQIKDNCEIEAFSKSFQGSLYNIKYRWKIYNVKYIEDGDTNDFYITSSRFPSYWRCK